MTTRHYAPATQTDKHNDRLRVAEASDLGLAPGQWPDEIVLTFEGQVAVQLYTRDEMMENAEEVVGFEYRILSTDYRLVVFND